MMAALTDKPQTYSSLIKVSFSHMKAKQMCIPDLGGGLSHGYSGTHTSSTYDSALSPSSLHLVRVWGKRTGNHMMFLCFCVYVFMFYVLCFVFMFLCFRPGQEMI